MRRLTEKKLAFIGPPGSGKSTLARAYAEKHGVKHVDTDDMFCARYGDIEAFFMAHGEEEFRKIEGELIVSAAESDAQVIACGGGSVLNRRGMNALRACADIVCLTAQKDVLVGRNKNSNRPLKCDIEKILTERAPLYARYADYTVDTSTFCALDRIEEALETPRGNRFDVILCDADETVLDFKRAMRYSVVRALRALGVKKDDDAIVSTYAEITNEVWGRLERGEISRARLNAQRFVMLRDRLKDNFDPQKANELYVTNMRSTRYTIDGATDFLHDVRGRGIKVYIITNSFTRIAEQRLKALDGFIDGAFISETVGFDKPDACFFDAVLERIGIVDRERVLVFGDGENSDIAGGINSGLTTCLFDPSGAKTTAADFSVRSYAQVAALI